MTLDRPNLFAHNFPRTYLIPSDGPKSVFLCFFFRSDAALETSEPPAVALSFCQPQVLHWTLGMSLASWSHHFFLDSSYRVLPHFHHGLSESFTDLGRLSSADKVYRSFSHVLLDIRIAGDITLFLFRSGKKNLFIC